MSIFPFGLFNKKANQALDQALLDLAARSQAEQDAIQRAKMALDHGANPNRPISTQLSSARAHRPVYPLEIGINCVSPQLVEMLLDKLAYETGTHGVAGMWIKQAMGSLSVPKVLETPKTQADKENIVKIGRLFVQHDFFMNSLNPDILFKDAFYFYINAEADPDPTQVELIFQILVNASTPKNIENLQKLATWHGSPDFFSVINLCIEKKKSADLHHVLTDEVATTQNKDDQNQQPTPRRKI